MSLGSIHNQVYFSNIILQTTLPSSSTSFKIYFLINFHWGSNQNSLQLSQMSESLEPPSECVRDRDDIIVPGNRRSKSSFSDFSDSLNSLNSLDSMNVTLHLGKTPMIYAAIAEETKTSYSEIPRRLLQLSH